MKVEVEVDERRRPQSAHISNEKANADVRRCLTTIAGCSTCRSRATPLPTSGVSGPSENAPPYKIKLSRCSEAHHRQPGIF